MIKIQVNNLKFLVNKNLSVLESCKFIGITLPRFCYHENLSIAGSCRMCVVEIFNTQKPIASCFFPVLHNMKILTNSPLVIKAKENISTSLLLNHPLDCPICDQSGECDLQDQMKLHGSDSKNFFFEKRGVEDKFFSTTIKTIMTRCIHCTRCVRFGSELAGTEFLGILNRGKSSEISNYSLNYFDSEISGTVIDLCPVGFIHNKSKVKFIFIKNIGALTSKTNAFKIKSWESHVTESIDCTDGLGSNIYINFKESEIFRIFPKKNINLNENIISDKARFFFDFLKNQKLQTIFEKKDKLIKSNWLIFFKQFLPSLSKKKNLFLVNNEIDLESINLLKHLAYKFKSKNIKIKSVDQSINKNNYFLNGLFSNVFDLNQKSSKICILIATNLKLENAILNTKLRLKFLNENITLYSFIQNNNTTNFIGLNIKSVLSFIESKNLLLSKLLNSFKNPIIIFGSSLLNKGIKLDFLFRYFKAINFSAILLNLAIHCNSEGLNFLKVDSVTQLDLIKSDAIFAINLNSNLILAKFIRFFSKNKNFVWLNSQPSNLMLKANFILPSASEFEEEKILVNLEQRPQKSFKTFSSIGDSKSLKSILIALLNLQTDFNTKFLNFIYFLTNNPFVFNNLQNLIFYSDFINNKFLLNNFIISTIPAKSVIEDFYCFNKSTRTSNTMILCSQKNRDKFINFVKNI